MKSHFEMMASYNTWANALLFKMSEALTDEQYRRDVGSYFKSLHGTLNHLLVTNRIWMRRLSGQGDHPSTLDTIAFQDLASLKLARISEDVRISEFVWNLEESDMERVWEYQTLKGFRMSQPIKEILAHLFNHQTHHRGQAHGILTAVGVVEPDALDLVFMQRLKK